MINREFITGAANSTSNVACWISAKSEQNSSEHFRQYSIIAYACNNLIVISDELAPAGNVICTLRGHKRRINSLTYVESNEIVEIYSFGEDASVIVWKCNDIVSHPDKWHVAQVLTGLITGVTASSVTQNSQLTCVFTSDSSGHVVIWAKYLSEALQTSEDSSPSDASSNVFVIIDKFEVPVAQMPHQLHSCVLPTGGIDNCSDWTLFMGCVDSKIHIRTASFQTIKNAYLEVVAGKSRAENKNIFRSCGFLSGHEEWITSLTTIAIPAEVISGEAPKLILMLASASQDMKIRLWRLEASSSNKCVTPLESINSSAVLAENDNDDEDASLEADEGDVKLDAEELLSEARLTYQGDNFTWAVYLDSLLIGHEDWVTSVHFLPLIDEQSTSLRIFSTSMDRNLLVWAPDKVSGVWSPSIRMGDMGGNLGGSVGGNLLGFVDGCINADGNALLGIGYGGSFHLWQQPQRQHTIIEDADSQLWRPRAFLTGHFRSVNDVAWSPCPSIGRATANDHYLVSVSSDQTCRLFAPLQNGDWHEISRPQIHGYDLNCLALMSPPSHNLFSGGDEKLIRVFTPPLCVVDGLEKLCGQSLRLQGNSSDRLIGADISSDEFQDEADNIITSRVYKAYIPELGLSNKAADLMSQQEQLEQEARGVCAVDWSQPPLEGQLSDHTIWPEIKKLFGHTSDVMCMALSSDQELLATASKARDAKAASIFIWETKKMVSRAELPGHESTVVCLTFSPDNKYLISGGKDRSICLFVRSALKSDSSLFSSYQVLKAAHKRIIWDCSWSEDSSLLMTASRDGVCKVWSVQISNNSDNTPALVCLYSFSPFGGVSVTAVSFGPNNIVAVGSEDGDIQVWIVSGNETDKTLLASVPEHLSHGAAVKKIKWKPSRGNSSAIHFASCSEDHTVRVYRYTDSSTD